MSDYTIKNLQEIDDAAPGFGLSPNLEARFGRKLLDCEKGGVGYEKLAPNFRVPFGHVHAAQEEVYVIASGSGRIKLEDEIVDVKQWDFIRVGPGTTRNFEAGPDGMEIVAFGAPASADAPNDAEIFPGWWSD
jgi:mannose-6-phosphate isomerase-like protein (cupin superfamily)